MNWDVWNLKLTWEKWGCNIVTFHVQTMRSTGRVYVFSSSKEKKKTEGLASLTPAYYNSYYTYVWAANTAVPPMTASVNLVHSQFTHFSTALSFFGWLHTVLSNNCFIYVQKSWSSGWNIILVSESYEFDSWQLPASSSNLCQKIFPVGLIYHFYGYTLSRLNTTAYFHCHSKEAYLRVSLDDDVTW